jgi:Ca2+-binding RTX toxin-like protein
MRSRIRCGVAAIAVAVTALSTVVSAAPASAGPVTTIRIPSGEVHFVAGDGQENRVTVTKLSGPAHVYRFDDVHPITFVDIYPVSAGACTYPDPADLTMMDCDHLATIINIKTGDLDDSITYRTSLSWQLEAGEGNDTIRTGTGAGSMGNYAAGGAGDDLIYSGPGDEYISGGAGIDTVTYLGRWAAITASVSGGGGQAGESDAYDLIENLTGGGGADTLTGNGSANVLDGGYATTPCLPTPGAFLAAPPSCTTYSGDDTLHGNGGADTLRGRAGEDALTGGAGYDALDGGSDWDACYVEADGGSRVNCEWPSIVVPPI